VTSHGLVSFVMPVWRPRPEWLRAAVASVLGQRDCRLELIVVDDGGDGAVGRLLADVADERLRVVPVAHGGAARARNAGLAEARGAWVRFVDADDVLPPESTARLLALAEPDETIAYGATLLCDEELRPRWRMTSRLQGWAERDCLLSRFAVRPPALLFPRSVIDRVGPWDDGFTVSEDWDYVLRALELAPVRGHREVALLYRRHGGGATRDVGAGVAGGRRVVARYFERHPELRGTRLERRAEAMLAAHAARVALTHGDARAAARALPSALWLDPRAVVAQVAQGLPALRAAAGRRLRQR
jgi:glycosyltransferase involved in cell wall biosynthesis